MRIENLKNYLVIDYRVSIWIIETIYKPIFAS